MTPEDETVCYLDNSRMSDAQNPTHFDADKLMTWQRNIEHSVQTTKCVKPTLSFRLPAACRPFVCPSTVAYKQIQYNRQDD